MNIKTVWIRNNFFEYQKFYFFFFKMKDVFKEMRK